MNDSYRTYYNRLFQEKEEELKKLSKCSIPPSSTSPFQQPLFNATQKVQDLLYSTN
jgi:hypothetical protein